MKVWHPVVINGKGFKPFVGFGNGTVFLQDASGQTVAVTGGTVLVEGPYSTE